MDHNRQLPHAHVVTDAGSLPLAVVVTGCIETGDLRCQDDATLVVATASRADTGRIMLFIFSAGVLLLLVALAQALLASDIKKNVSASNEHLVFGDVEYESKSGRTGKVATNT